MSRTTRQSMLRTSSLLARMVNAAIDIALIALICAVVAFASFTLWDNNRIITTAQAETYQVFRPTVDDTLSFEELRRINPDVFAWLTVYGTNIDFPVVDTDNNQKYLNTNVMGEHSLSGALFLDEANEPDFTDFNSIIHGHHMAESAMFGDIELFDEAAFFASHKYGNLFFSGADHGIEFFAFLETHAYAWDVFNPAIKSEDARQEYLDMIARDAVHYREINVTTDDHIVLLGTCAPEQTNGKYVLAGRLTDEVFADEFAQQDTEPDRRFVDDAPYLLAVPFAILASCIVLFMLRKKRRDEDAQNKTGGQQNLENHQTEKRVERDDEHTA